jgi:hypothetical protein
MTRMARHLMIVGGVAAVAVIAAMVIGPRTAHGAATRLKPGECFRQSDIRGWAAPDEKTLFVRTQLGRIYRVSLSNRCLSLTMHSAHLISRSFGPDLICAALDMNLRVSDGANSIAEPCLVQGITMLTVDESKALPRNAKP